MNFVIKYASRVIARFENRLFLNVFSSQNVMVLIHSELVRIHLTPLHSIWHHFTPFGTTSLHLAPFHSFRNHFTPFRPISPFTNTHILNNVALIAQKDNLVLVFLLLFSFTLLLVLGEFEGGFHLEARVTSFMLHPVS